MRQRRIKNEDEILASFQGLLIGAHEGHKGHWNQIFGNQNPICLELGCGKGKFIAETAKRNLDINFIAIEGQKSVMVRALQKLELLSEQWGISLKNIRYMRDMVKDVADVFEVGELAGIYLNFSDPWPKDRHSKRRLTHTGYLNGYKTVLKNGGFIEVKTDNDDLFAFTIEEFRQNGLEIVALTQDLHRTGLPAGDTTTEYEEKFKKMGKSINYCRAVYKLQEENL